MFRTGLCDYSDAYILVTGTIKITGAENDDAARQLDQRDKGVIFEYCMSFTDYINEILKQIMQNAQML